jgi:hypothetical protein
MLHKQNVLWGYLPAILAFFDALYIIALKDGNKCLSAVCIHPTYAVVVRTLNNCALPPEVVIWKEEYGIQRAGEFFCVASWPLA